MTFNIPSLPFLESACDITSLSLIAALLLLSLLSLIFIFYLRLKSRSSLHLQKFNSLWTVRFLLVIFISLWGFNELLRLPFFRRGNLSTFLPHLTLKEQANLCKIHAVLSLGFLEPGFLVTLLFLVTVSFKEKIPRGWRAIVFVFATCLPVFLLQILFLFHKKLESRFPSFSHRSWILYRTGFGDETVLCTYPLVSTILFGAFGSVYTLSFFVSCWRVVSLVINKGLRIRIYGLTFTILVALPLQILCLGLSVMWSPEEQAYRGVELVVFLSALTCAAAGEGILVIKPIADSLAAGGVFCHRVTPSVRLGRDIEASS
ncbi:hypothetical protein CFOL_v3_33035 [Cephalotus follicularis]|uniref:Uncharacterized protein n=1 Tax=Cephalotus follicularis TaxID=3775 RepID=A0A1Q3DAZ7_CEPFO|nr:hypothetical protein CFOL_v3_33035 [Cephalotus follicularis]